MIVITDQGRNIDAIARYIGAQVAPRTDAARAVRDEWQRFYSGLSDFEANFEQQAYDRARNLKLQYNLANALTEAERAAVMHQALEGVSSEQVAGDPDRRTSGGTYAPPPSASGQIARAIGAVGIGLGLLLLVRR